MSVFLNPARQACSGAGLGASGAPISRRYEKSQTRERPPPGLRARRLAPGRA